MTATVYIDREEGLEAPGDDSFSCWIDAALRAGAYSGAFTPEITVRIAGEREIAALNLQFRKRAQPTNVLSFPASFAPEVESGLLGDIVICAPIVITEAAANNKSLTAHWAHMTVHGTLHLLGFDHLDDREAEIMETLEINTLYQLGYKNPYQTQSEPESLTL